MEWITIGMMEKRTTDRTTVSIPGRLIGERLNTPCTIIDVSPTGARLQIEPGLFLPKQVTVRARDWGPDRVVQIVWRNKTQIGIRF